MFFTIVLNDEWLRDFVSVAICFLNWACSQSLLLKQFVTSIIIIISYQKNICVSLGSFLQGQVSRSELPGRPIELFMCSILKRQGYGEGFRWIAQYINWV